MWTLMCLFSRLGRSNIFPHVSQGSIVFDLLGGFSLLLFMFTFNRFNGGEIVEIVSLEIFPSLSVFSDLMEC